MSAAVRMSAFSLGDKGKYCLYSSTPLRPYPEHAEDRDLETSRQPKSGKGYGISLTDEVTAKQRFTMRRKLFRRKCWICDWSVYFAVSGLVLAVCDAEMHTLFGGSELEGHVQKFSTVIKLVNIVLTICLDVLILLYHYIDLQIMSVDTGQSILHMGFQKMKRFKIAIELIVCSICPLPIDASVRWNVLSSPVSDPRTAEIPLHIVLTLPMFLRLYLMSRYTVIHSFTVRDAATRAIAALNQISVDFPYVLKTLICDQPMKVVCIAGVTFLTTISWMLTQCERYASGNALTNAHYFFDYAWFEAVTFFAIGYGDIPVDTLCGRSLAIFTGVVGNITSSLVTVLLSRQMLLTLSERRVNQVIAESQLSNVNRNAAARVLQWAWRTSCWRRKVMNEIEEKHQRKTTMFHMRTSQRRLLQAILNFRRCRWKLRLRMEEEDDVIAVQRAFHETENHLRGIRQRQTTLRLQLTTLATTVDILSQAIDKKCGKSC